MKLLSYLLIFLSSYLFGQAPDIVESEIYCEGGETIIEIVNPNDTIVYWYSVNEENALLDSGNTLSIYLNNTKLVAGVRGTDTTYIHLDKFINGCHCRVYVPNAFTPDGDEFNEKFEPVINCEVTAVNFYIYDRLGNEVFKSYELNPIWNGIHQTTGGIISSGVLVYLLYYVTKDGKTHMTNGFINVMT